MNCARCPRKKLAHTWRINLNKSKFRTVKVNCPMLRKRLKPNPNAVSPISRSLPNNCGERCRPRNRPRVRCDSYSHNLFAFHSCTMSCREHFGRNACFVDPQHQTARAAFEPRKGIRWFKMPCHRCLQLISTFEVSIAIRHCELFQQAFKL